ncbi:hypothetical protein MPH_08118 [Macrophomina phaseolina MS6]|uniref:Transmembrane protein n=1 Tax=Macrophomina phaseolina (strain MS6) TaxID=1126212 RepID=K2SCR7_MACPH|nr:hypothetical protein MPH_08118 [Macrophomina phaseolina MS6]
MPGALVPPWWKGYEVSASEMAVVSIVWGASLGWSVFASVTAVKQTLQIRKRAKRLTAYIFMIWAELVASLIISFISWFYMMGDIPPSFEFYFFVLVLWVIQIQVILQIIVNRVGLLVPDKDRVRNMKWFVGIYVGIINVSVFCIWMPAQLQRSTTYVHINHVWDRVTKGLVSNSAQNRPPPHTFQKKIKKNKGNDTYQQALTKQPQFLLLDAALNFYFLYMVRRDLIANGLYKYTTLFWSNAAMAVVSVFMDVAIILSMSFKNPFVYVQFHPLAYIFKLSIEMSLADLIAKVVHASNRMQDIDGATDLNNLGYSFSYEAGSSAAAPGAAAAPDDCEAASASVHSIVGRRQTNQSKGMKAGELDDSREDDGDGYEGKAAGRHSRFDNHGAGEVGEGRERLKQLEPRSIDDGGAGDVTAQKAAGETKGNDPLSAEHLEKVAERRQER